MRIEIACFNPESASIADQSGADRIELCDGYAVGGTTPATDIVREVRHKTKTVLFVMIRPRGGDFCYSDAEFAQMKADILTVKPFVDGFVFGVLHPDATIDTERNKILIDLAQPLPATFHRAFDQVSEPLSALEEIIACGFSTVLTSGTKSNVIEGAPVLKTLVEKAANRITVMPGGGLRSTNLAALHETVGAHFYHSSAITDGSQMADADEIKALKNIG
ncbi:PF03932 family protein CutC [Flavobacterium longum]|uniref:copper homeostasis protein CutC n=1 Tax=Flavobacterium longum TaxID=1299340 RepID=UPI0039EC5222